MKSREYWQRIYEKRAPDQVGWFEREPATSLHFIEAALAAGADSVIDVGGGSSSLVDRLLEMGVGRVAVMDISDAGLQVARQRLGARASEVEWIVGDMTQVDDVGSFDVWHDRAAFHFLLDPDAQRRYVALSERAVGPGGTAVIATFALDGPETCSGLPVQRYGADQLSTGCGPRWRLTESRHHVHTTPGGVDQAYLYCAFGRTDAPTE